MLPCLQELSLHRKLQCTSLCGGIIKVPLSIWHETMQASTLKASDIIHMLTPLLHSAQCLARSPTLSLQISFQDESTVRCQSRLYLLLTRVLTRCEPRSVLNQMLEGWRLVVTRLSTQCVLQARLTETLCIFLHSVVNQARGLAHSTFMIKLS